MEKINWICKSKTVNNNIVWMCHPKVKEHFESTSSTAILGSTSFPNTVDITLGPASFGPTTDLASDTIGFTKLGEWTLALQDGTPAMNNEFFEGKTKGLMVYNGDRNITDWSKWPNEWGYRYQTPMLTGIDKNGFNAGAAIFEFQNYQEFDTLKYKIILRNKSNPQNYFIMPRVVLYSDGNLGPIGYGPDNFDPGAAMDQQISRYKGLNWTPEICMRGQGGGKVVYNDVYEIFVKPFTRPTFPFKGEPKVNDFSNLDSNLASKLLLWLDGNDPLGDGTVLPDDTPVPYWNDKSSNKVQFIRHPYDRPQIKDGERLPNGRKLRVPRCKAKMKNGLSVMRFNGVNGYFNNVHNHPATDKWVQNPANKNITEYTIISLQFTTDYASQQATIFTANSYSGNCKTMIGNVAFGSPMLSFLTNTNNTTKYWQNDINVLNKWSLFTTVVSNTEVNMFVNGVSAPNKLQDWQQNQTPYKSGDGIIDSFGMTCVVGGHSGNESNAAFIGDIGEFLFFKGALSDDDRQKVEGYLAIKWNLASILPTSNPYIIDIANSAQLFTGTNYGATSNYFSVGRYTNSQLKTIGIKALQSLKIPSGLQVLLYQNGDFTGLAKSIIADTADLSSVTDSRNTGFKWNNQMQSLIVQKYIPLPTSISADMPPISLISSDANSFLSTVKGAVLTRIDDKDYLFVDPTNKDNTFWYNASDLQVTPAAPVATTTELVTLAQHCDNAGWKKSIGVGTFNSGNDFPADSSYITVPQGLSATLTTGSGQVEKITGPNVFNFCSKGDFNDNVKKIVVVTGSTPA